MTFSKANVSFVIFADKINYRKYFCLDCKDLSSNCVRFEFWWLEYRFDRMKSS